MRSSAAGHALATVIMTLFTFASAAQDAGCTLPPTQIYENVSGKIVKIISLSIDQHRVVGRVQPGTGTGMLIGPGLILTNFHVVKGGGLIGVSSDDWAFEAELLGGDPVLDLAVLRIPFADQAFDALEFGSYAELKVGQRAYVLGHPMGVGLTMSEGLISGLDRRIPINTLSWTTSYIQTDAAISPGNSGSALLDACGRVVGMVSMTSGDPQAENLGYALPIDSILPLVEEIRTKGRVSRPWHGIYGQMMTPLIAALIMTDPTVAPEGFMIETVEPGSAADKIGLMGGLFPVMWGVTELLVGGDIITQVNGHSIKSLEDALGAVGRLEIGEVIKLQVWREGQLLDFEVALEERPMFESDLWNNSQSLR